MLLPLLGGAALGVLSRVDETDLASGLISTRPTWILVAFLAGALVPGRAIVSGVVAMTSANVAYYAWIAATESLDGVAASPWERWLVIGAVTGTVLGAAGGYARRRVAVR